MEEELDEGSDDVPVLGTYGEDAASKFSDWFNGLSDLGKAKNKEFQFFNTVFAALSPQLRAVHERFRDEEGRSRDGNVDWELVFGEPGLRYTKAIPKVAKLIVDSRRRLDKKQTETIRRRAGKVYNYRLAAYRNLPSNTDSETVDLHRLVVQKWKDLVIRIDGGVGGALRDNESSPLLTAAAGSSPNC